MRSVSPTRISRPSTRRASALQSATSASVTAAAQRWYDHYERGVRALEAGDAETAVRQLERAIRKRPEPGERILTYGTNRLAHFEPLWAMIRDWMPKLKAYGEAFFGVPGALMLPHAVDDRCNVVGSFWTGTIDHVDPAGDGGSSGIDFRDLDLANQLPPPMERPSKDLAVDKRGRLVGAPHHRSRAPGRRRLPALAGRCDCSGGCPAESTR